MGAPPLIDVFPTPSGQLSARAGDQLLHSRYDPRKEAERYLAARQLPPGAHTVLCMGPALGYVVRAVAERYPDARLLIVSYAPGLAPYAARAVDAAHAAGRSRCWNPASGSLLDFLRTHLDEVELDGMVVVGWEPSARAFADVDRMAGDALRQTVAEHRASFATTAGFGQRWMRNALRNCLALSCVQPPAPVTQPVLVAASGPSLGEVVSEIGAQRSALQLWATPSAIPALQAGGLQPDLVVQTDAGYFARRHFDRAGALPLAMPLAAAQPPASTVHQAPVTLFHEGHRFELELLRLLDACPPLITPAGTVTASAIALAHSSGAPAVFVAGLDLCYRDIHGHVRPNAFEPFVSGAATRLAPGLSAHYARALEAAPDAGELGGQRIRKSPALDAYAAWFASGDLRCARLAPSPVHVPTMQQVAPGRLGAALAALAASSGASGASHRTAPRPTLRWPAVAERQRLVAALLQRWRHQIDAAGAAPQPPEDARRLAQYIDPLQLRAVLRARRSGENWRTDWRVLLQACREFVDNQNRLLGER